MHLVALIVLVSPLTKDLTTRLTSHHYASLIRPVIVLAFTGTMIEHLTGGILYATVFGKAALNFWPVIFLVYPIERTILVVRATLIGASLLSLLRPSVFEGSLETSRKVVSSPIREASGREHVKGLAGYAGGVLARSAGRGVR